MKEVIFNSVVETQSFAADFAKTVPLGTVIGLIGDLGTGKTTFSQGFAKGLGIKDKVISPTFKLVSEYEGKNPFYHIDCYRLESSFDFLNIGGEEYLVSDDGVTLIEWADIIGELLPEDTVRIRFSRIQDHPESRQIEIKGFEGDI